MTPPEKAKGDGTKGTYSLDEERSGKVYGILLASVHRGVTYMESF